MTEPNSNEEKPMRAMFEHCCSVYDAMKEESTQNYDGAASPVPEVVYEGHLTRLFQSLELSPPYYSQVRELLVKMGCIEQLRRGGGNSKSRWRLVTRPTEETFSAADALVKRPMGKVAMLEQGLREAHKRIRRLEEAVGIPLGG